MHAVVLHGPNQKSWERFPIQPERRHRCAVRLYRPLFAREQYQAEGGMRRQSFPAEKVRTTRHRTGRRARGDRRVPESETALRTAVEILGPRIGRLTLAGVTDFDYGSSQAKADTERALESLRAMVASSSVRGLGIIILSGRPADALTEYALRDGYQLLVVGRRGRGASKAILGSTAAQLASVPIPVLVAA
jgi:nucleotide-binding universal stress UspA family protein